jgi:uncharacterized Fe-S cluster-containing radical SAM superfamily enzyme
VPTNGRLLRPEVIDKLGDAGVATFNLALDAIDEKPSYRAIRFHLAVKRATR